MRGVFLPLGLPGAPHRRLLLGDADEYHPTLAIDGCSRVDQRTGNLLLVVTPSGPPQGDPLVALHRGAAAIPRRYEVARYG
jgi:hypothetical protein